MRISLYFFLLIPLFLCPSACSKNPASKGPDVLVSVPPYIYFVEEISEHTLSVDSAVPVGYDPHLFEISPKKMSSFSSAKVWIGIGELYEDSLNKALLQQNPQLVAIDLSDEYEEHGHDHHCAHGSLDRHFWMSPKITIEQAKVIAETLTKAFPEKQEVFARGLSTLTQQLIGLDEDIKNMLRDVEGKSILVSHPAFGYFCRDYNLKQLSVEFDGKSPLPEHILTLVQETKKEDLLCILVQPQVDNKGATAFASMSGKPMFMIDPQDPSYIKLMQSLAHIISHANPDTSYLSKEE